MHAYVWEDEKLSDVVRGMREKSEVFIVRVTRPLPCWVRSHGRSKVPNKNVSFWFSRGEARGFARLSSLCVSCPFYFSCSFLAPASSNSASIRWLLVIGLVLWFWPFQGQVTFMLICLTWRWTKQRLYCSTPLEVQFEFSPRNLLAFFIIATIS